MARPKLDLTNALVGNLRIISRIPSKQPRFTYTCITCGTSGEADARYLHRGCKHCASLKPSGSNASTAQVQVLTSTNSYWIPTTKLTVELRANPTAAFYYKQKRVTLVETSDDLIMSQADYYGVPVRLAFPKMMQDLEGQSIVPPAFYTNPDAPATMPIKANSPAQLPETHTTTPTENLVVAEYQPPTEWLLLEKALDSQWLKEDYPQVGSPPKYMLDWLDQHDGEVLRVASANNQLFAAASPRLQVPVASKAIIFDDADMDWNPGSEWSKPQSAPVIEEASSKAQAEPTEQLSEVQQMLAEAKARRERDAEEAQEDLDSRRRLKLVGSGMSATDKALAEIDRLNGV